MNDSKTVKTPTSHQSRGGTQLIPMECSVSLVPMTSNTNNNNKWIWIIAGFARLTIKWFLNVFRRFHWTFSNHVWRISNKSAWEHGSSFQRPVTVDVSERYDTFARASIDNGQRTGDNCLRHMEKKCGFCDNSFTRACIYCVALDSVQFAEISRFLSSCYSTNVTLCWLFVHSFCAQLQFSCGKCDIAPCVCVFLRVCVASSIG